MIAVEAVLRGGRADGTIVVAESYVVQVADPLSVWSVLDDDGPADEPVPLNILEYHATQERDFAGRLIYQYQKPR